MVALKKYNYDTEIISFRIRKTIRDAFTTPMILYDLGQLFQAMASHLSQTQLDTITDAHPLGNAVIEILPEKKPYETDRR